MAKILISHGLPMAGFDVLRQAGHTVIAPDNLKAFTEDELVEHIADCDAMVAGGATPARVIDAGKKLIHIANYGAGYDSVDWRHAATVGIPVTNIPETVTYATAELAMTLILTLCRRVSEKNLLMRTGAPERLFGMGREMGLSACGLTLGIIGCGRIGSKTAEMAKCFGMRVLGYSRRGCDPAKAEPTDLNTLLAESDIISLHCPATEETKHLINKDTLAMMKPGAMIVNTARGAVIDTDALCDALESGRLRAAALDVFPEEPHVPARLLTFDNVVLTPHIGSNIEQTRREMAEACSLQILDALAGKLPKNVVNGVTELPSK